MANSKCPHCKSTSFELQEVSPTKSKYKLNFIQCSSCGAPFGITEYYNTTAMLEKQNEAIKKIANALNVYVEL
jgi:predicted nucleic-acid-binding Zn-ribbon protein